MDFKMLSSYGSCIKSFQVALVKLDLQIWVNIWNSPTQEIQNHYTPN